MLTLLWNQLLFYPLVNGLIFFYLLVGNLGWSIIVLTVLLRILMTPLVLPGMKLSKKMQDLAPELARLKAQFKDDKQKLLAAQAELYKQHGANPASGCLPQILQLLILIALFNALNLLLSNHNSDLPSKLQPVLYSLNRLPSDFKLATRFFYLDLAKPDVIRLPNVPLPLPGIFLLLSAVAQLVSGKMMTPTVSSEKKIAKATPQESDDAMVVAQQQMIFMFPVMTVIFGYQFPSGLVLYWLVFTLVSSTQQYMVTGWGGLQPWVSRARLLFQVR